MSFEALCSILPRLNRSYNLNNEISNLFNLLKKRHFDGLFYFKNKEARLDITSHVLNGLFVE